MKTKHLFILMLFSVFLISLSAASASDPSLKDIGNTHMGEEINLEGNYHYNLVLEDHNKDCVDLKEDCHDNLFLDEYINEDVNEDVNGDVNEDVNGDVNEDVNEDINEDVNGDVNKDINNGNGKTPNQSSQNPNPEEGTFSDLNRTIADEGTFSDLNRTINSNSDDVISLDKDYTFDYYPDRDLQRGIIIDRPLTILGNGHRINAISEARIFNVTCDNVVFKDIKFIGGCTLFLDSKYDVSGAAIYGSPTVINCLFENNHVLKYGAAIDGNATAINCTFSNNVAYGGDISGAMYGGYAINCTFVNNTGYGKGGAMYGGYAENCSFIENFADLYGGAIYDSVAVNCNFTDNLAGFVIFEETGYGGGAAYSSLVNCVFKNNRAFQGTACYHGSMIGCLFENNDVFETGLLQAYLDVSDFTTSFASGEKMPFSVFANLEFNGKRINVPVYGIKTNIFVFGNEGSVFACEVLSGNGVLLDLEPGIYNVAVSVDGLPNVQSVMGNVEISKSSSKIVFDFINDTRGATEYLIINVLHENGLKKVGNACVNVTIGTETKTYLADSNGQVIICLKDLNPADYFAVVSFDGDDEYLGCKDFTRIMVRGNRTIGFASFNLKNLQNDVHVLDFENMDNDVPLLNLENGNHLSDALKDKPISLKLNDNIISDLKGKMSKALTLKVNQKKVFSLKAKKTSISFKSLMDVNYFSWF